MDQAFCTILKISTIASLILNIFCIKSSLQNVVDHYMLSLPLWRLFLDKSTSGKSTSKSQKLQKSQFLLGTLLPPLTPDLSNFSKNCDFFNFSQFLEKSQFLLGTPLPSLPLEFSTFSEDCDFPIFRNFWSNRRNRSFCWALLYLVYHLNFVSLVKTAISPIFCHFCYCVLTWTYLSEARIKAFHWTSGARLL